KFYKYGKLVTAMAHIKVGAFAPWSGGVYVEGLPLAAFIDGASNISRTAYHVMCNNVIDLVVGATQLNAEILNSSSQTAVYLEQSGPGLTPSGLATMAFHNGAELWFTVQYLTR